tara:strand:+ start:4992 stop:5414 length:423 start_codon:yes stop_codon:yes gene_type:complete
MSRYKKQKFVSEINIVPYVDVMLVLLVIFMATAPLLTQGVKVDLPQAKAKIIAQDNTIPIIVSVDYKGHYFLNISEKPSEEIIPKDLVLRIAAELNIDKNRQVMVQGDKTVDYGKIVTAMALLQQAGVNNVGLVTDPNIS